MGARVLKVSAAPLEEQLEICPSIVGKTRDKVLDYLTEYGITDISEIDIACQLEYRRWLWKNQSITPAQRKSYGSALEQIGLVYYVKNPTEIVQEIQRFAEFRGAVANKTVVYLCQSGIPNCTGIDYMVRQSYTDYLFRTIAKSKVQEYVKMLDRIKLAAIKADNEKNPLRVNRLKFAETVYFLQYHPDYPIAKSLYYTNDKTELVFDFSLPGAKKLKEQIFSMLNHVVETEKNQKMRHEAYLVPLKKLYLYCLEQGITDIETLSQKQADGFRKSMDGQVGTKLGIYLTVVDNTREYLFIHNTKTNWEATIWYLDRFDFAEDRYNAANPVRRLRFDDIENEENQRCFQLYMKYLIGITDKAIVNIRSKYYYIHDFLLFCEKQNITASDIRPDQIAEYFAQAGEKDISAASYDKYLAAIYQFYKYLQSKEIVKYVPFSISYYYKKYRIKHNDRVVPENVQQKMLESLVQLPYQLRLMFLTLWAVGLRLEEVCTLKADAFLLRGNNGYLYIRQTKQRNEKVIPVPQVYFDLMTKYIEDQKIMPGAYIFQNSKGGAYYTETFRKQMREHCRVMGISCGDYLFRAHDYRHTVATDMHNDGVSIQVLRQYLGHRDDNMTKQYIDHLPQQIINKSREYFSKSDNTLLITEEKNEHRQDIRQRL